MLEKKYANSLTKLSCIIGIIICLTSMFVLPTLSKDYSFSPRFEILLLILVYKTLKEIELKG